MIQERTARFPSVAAMELERDLFTVLDTMLVAGWERGWEKPTIHMSAAGILAAVHVAERMGTITRVASAGGETVFGLSIVGYKHPMDGSIVPMRPRHSLGVSDVELVWWQE